MGVPGISTRHFPEAAVADDVLVNAPAGTGRMTMANLAQQLMADGPLADRLDSQDGDYAGSVALVADIAGLGLPAGREVRVFGEPVLGDRGVYQTTAGAPVRLGPLPGGDTAALDAEMAAGRGGLPSLADHLTKITKAGLPLTTAFGEPLYLDHNALINGTAVYIPRQFLGRRGAMVLDGSYGVADAKLTNHVRLPYVSGAGNIWVVYADLADAASPYKITAHTSPPPTNRPDEIVMLMVIYGSAGQYWSPYRTVVIEPDDHQVIPRYPLIVDGDTLYIPEFYFWSRASGFVLVSPTDGARYFRHAISVNIGTPFRHFFDYLAYLANTADPSAAVKSVSGTNNPDGESSRYFPLIATSLNRTVRSRHAVAGRNHGGVGRNMFAGGRLPGRGASFLSTSSVAAASAPILAQGFTECVTAPAGQSAFYGGDLAARASGSEFMYCRALFETSADGNWGAPRIFVYLDGASVTSFMLVPEEQISPTLRWYAFYGRIGVGPINMYKVGVTAPAGVTMRVAGAQVCIQPEPAQWIMRGDYAADPGEMEPIYGNKLRVIAGRRLQLYLANMISTRDQLDQYSVSLSSVGGSANLPYVAKGRQSIEIDPDRLGATATLRFRRLGPLSVRDTVREIALAVDRKPAAGLAGSPKILFVGDSHPNGGLVNRTDVKLLSTGLTPVWLGTINTSNTDGSSAAENGKPAEARGGRAWGHYTLRVNDGTLAPVGPGEHGAYLLADKPTRIGLNPMIRPAVGGDDPTRVVNGYIPDFGQYSTLYLGGVMPDIFLFSLGSNDAAGQPMPQSVEHVVEGLRIYIGQIRLVAPDAPIGWMMPPLPGSYAGDERWLEQQAIIRAGVDYIRGLGDAKVDAIPVWAHVDPDGEWQIDMASGLNPATGVRTSRIIDHIHLGYYTLREQAAEVLAGWIANVYVPPP